MRVVRAAVGGLVDFLLPAICRHCDAPVRGGDWAPLLCHACGADISWHDAAVDVPPPLARAWALAVFEGPARRLLLDLKYAGVLRAGAALGARMAVAPGVAALLEDVDLIVPVPLHWRRRWWRGHNQAVVLARALARARVTRGPCPYASVLRRRRSTPPQVGLPRPRRLGNVVGAFEVRPGRRALVAGRTIALVDDVITTGSTVAAAATALRDAGAGSVVAYAAAWAPD